MSCLFCCQPFPSMSVWSQNDAIKSCHIYKKDKNDCFILDFFGSDLSKMDQTWSNLLELDFSPIKKCFYTKLSHLQIGYKLPFYFGLDWIRSVQNGLNLTKSVQIGSKKIRINRIDQMVQIRLNWFKLDQNGSNWITLVQISLNWFKSDKIGSNWIKSDQVGSNWFKVKQIRLIRPNWTKLY